jgi:hypothetical protein
MLLRFLFSGALVTFLVASCGNDVAPGGFSDPGSSGGSSGTSGSSGFGGPGDGGTPSDTVACSADLHSVVDGNGKVLKTCPLTEGCAEGKCVPACESAKSNKSTIGCDYYTLVPDAINPGSCFAAFIANTWGAPVKLQVERGGTMLNVSQFARIPTGSGQSITYAPLASDELPAGQVAILFLNVGGSIACPAGITPATTTAGNIVGTGLGTAFHVTASAPIVAYDVYPYGGGSSAITSSTLLIPTTAWDVNYIGVNAYRTSMIAGQPSLDIVAESDGTAVTVSPTVALTGGAGVSGTPAGTPATYMLNRGQILQFVQPAEFTGSAIQSNKPIGVFGGATCLSIDVSQFACDAAHQQLPPVKALGNDYVGVRYRNRVAGMEESPPWRIVGAVNGTTLTYEPSMPPGAPVSIGSGQVLEFNSPGGFRVKSQDVAHPFYMSAHMTGCGTISRNGDCRGDPEFVNIIPPQQWLRSYVFFTDPTYPETNLVVTRAKTAGGFKDVTLDCAGVLTGWQPIGADFEYTRIDLVSGNFQKQGACDNGLHEMKSDGTFGLTVWGWGSAASGSFFSQAVSYAYPAGASVKPVNTVVVPAVPK